MGCERHPDGGRADIWRVVPFPRAATSFACRAESGRKAAPACGVGSPRQNRLTGPGKEGSRPVPSAPLPSDAGGGGVPQVLLKTEGRRFYRAALPLPGLLLVFKLEKQWERTRGEKFRSHPQASSRVLCHLRSVQMPVACNGDLSAATFCHRL